MSSQNRFPGPLSATAPRIRPLQGLSFFNPVRCATAASGAEGGLYSAVMSNADPVLLLLTTCPDPASADRIAQALVGECLAACVTRLDGARSTYRWQGQIATDAELQLLVKTTASRLDAAMARLLELHPYELPECFAVEAVAGLPAYMDWIRAQTREEHS